MKKARTIIVVILMILVVIVILQNMQMVKTDFLFTSVTMPRAVLLIITLLIGFGAGVVTSNRLRRKAGKP